MPWNLIVGTRSYDSIYREEDPELGVRARLLSEELLSSSSSSVQNNEINTYGDGIGHRSRTHNNNNQQSAGHHYLTCLNIFHHRFVIYEYFNLPLSLSVTLSLSVSLSLSLCLSLSQSIYLSINLSIYLSI